MMPTAAHSQWAVENAGLENDGPNNRAGRMLFFQLCSLVHHFPVLLVV